MPQLPRQIRLAAGDYFMHGQDRRMRRYGLPGNVCRVALRVDGGLDADLLRRRVAESPILNWLARVRIVRSLPLMPPRWEAAPEPKTIFYEHNGEGRDGSPVAEGRSPKSEGRRKPEGRGPKSKASSPTGESASDFGLRTSDFLRPSDFELRTSASGEASLPDLDAAVGSLPPAVTGRDLHSAEGPSLALDLVKHNGGGNDLVISWNHALMDARGAEFILRHLDAADGVKDAPTLDNLINPAQQEWNLSKWWKSVKLARGCMEWLRQSGSEPLFTLLPGLSPAGPCRCRQRLISFTEEETARVDARCHNLNAAFRRSQLYLASSIRALHTVAQARGNRDGAYLMPVPHDMRKRGSNGPIFSNQLSILFYRIEARQAASLGETIAELTRQMMNQIRGRFPEACMAALDMFKPMPLDYYVRHLGQPTGGKFASLCFSDSGETCAGMSTMLGGRITEVTHLVPTWRPPGLTVLFWSFNGRPRVLLSWVDDCLSSSEVRVLEQGLRSALLEEEIA